jgi:hypothetical protein
MGCCGSYGNAITAAKEKRRGGDLANSSLPLTPNKLHSRSQTPPALDRVVQLRREEVHNYLM